jgi:poly-gamma-glutamate system protein
VAVGASGSFPALLVAALAATEALGAEAVVILSLGASSYGATRPDFHLLDLHQFLLGADLVEAAPVAVSLGGDGDGGEELDDNVREALIREVETRGYSLILEADLPSNLQRRMEVYGSVSAFINVGGAEANMGTHSRVLSIPPGLSLELADRVDPPPREERGVLFEMAARGFPVIHLLNVRGLALRYGLPWDPASLPEAGATRLRDNTRGKDWRFWTLTAAYLGALVLIALGGMKEKKEKARDPVR